MRRVAIAAGALTLAGCYEYGPVSPTSTNLGQSVRVDLTDAGSSRIAALVGPRATYIDGKLVSISDSTLTISITDIGRRNASEESWNGEPVDIRRTDAEQLSLRRISNSKSAGLTAVLLGGAAFIAKAIQGNEGTIRSQPGGRPGGQ